MPTPALLDAIIHADPDLARLNRSRKARVYFGNPSLACTLYSLFFCLLGWGCQLRSEVRLQHTRRLHPPGHQAAAGPAPALISRCRLMCFRWGGRLARMGAAARGHHGVCCQWHFLTLTAHVQLMYWFSCVKYKKVSPLWLSPTQPARRAWPPPALASSLEASHSPSPTAHSSFALLPARCTVAGTRSLQPACKTNIGRFGVPSNSNKEKVELSCLVGIC